MDNNFSSKNFSFDDLDTIDASNINRMVHIVDKFNVKQGWRDKSDKIRAVLQKHAPELIPVFNNYVSSTMIALMHSELSEALEANRKNLMDDHLPHRKGLHAELADVIIRVFDMAGQEGIPLGEVVVEKFNYNKTREDHKLENRAKPGGKAF